MCIHVEIIEQLYMLEFKWHSLCCIFIVKASQFEIDHFQILFAIISIDLAMIKLQLKIDDGKFIQSNNTNTQKKSIKN